MPGLRVLRQADGTGWDPVRIAGPGSTLMKRLGYDALRRARRRLGRDHHRRDGRAGARRAARHSLQHARRRPGRCSQALARNVLGAGDPPPSGLSAEEQRAFEQLSFFYTKGIGYAHRDGDAPADAVRACRFTRRARGLDARPRRAQLRGHRRRRRRAPRRQPDPGRGARQHHALLADEHRGLLGPSVLGEHARLLRRQGRHGPGRGERLPATSSTRPPAAGPSGPTPTSSTSTRSTGAATSRPGRSRSCSRTSCARRSGPFANRANPAAGTRTHPSHPHLRSNRKAV